MVPPPQECSQGPDRVRPTGRVLMVRPCCFAYNAETAESNRFQVPALGPEQQEIHNRALAEFDGFCEGLEAHGIELDLFHDDPVPHTPDSLFPNNWVSFHEDGTLILYPLQAMSRREEIRRD
ncbi:MAG: arginine deiminase-related protein [Planctomycetota bacterium]